MREYILNSIPKSSNDFLIMAWYLSTTCWGVHPSFCARNRDAVFIRATNPDYIASALLEVTDIDVGWYIYACQMPNVQRSVCVRERGCDKVTFRSRVHHSNQSIRQKKRTFYPNALKHKYCTPCLAPFSKCGTRVANLDYAAPQGANRSIFHVPLKSVYCKRSCNRLLCACQNSNICG